MKFLFYILVYTTLFILSFMACVEFDIPEPNYNNPYDTASIYFNDELNGGDWYNSFNYNLNIIQTQIVCNNPWCFLIGGAEKIDSSFRISCKVFCFPMNNTDIFPGEINPMNKARIFSSAAALNNCLYIFGGDTLGTFEYIKLNQSPMNWNIGGSIPNVNMSFGSFSTIFSNKIIIGGGESAMNKVGQKEKSNEIWQFDPLLNNWSFLTTLPFPVSFATSQIIGDNLFIIGGFNIKEEALDIINVYNINSHSWSIYPDSLNISRGNTVSTTRNDRIYIMGGILQSGQYTDVVDELKLKKSLCVAKSPINSILSVYGCYLNDANDIILIGGDEVKEFRIFKFELPY